MVIYPMIRHGHISESQAFLSYVVANSALLYWVTQVSTPAQARKVFTALIVLSHGYEIFGVTDRKWLQANIKSRRVFYGNSLMFLLAVAQWKASESGGPLCDPESLWQGHSLWHFQSAIGIAGIFLYYLYEELPAAKNSTKSRNMMTTPLSCPARANNSSKGDSDMYQRTPVSSFDHSANVTEEESEGLSDDAWSESSEGH